MRLKRLGWIVAIVACLCARTTGAEEAQPRPPSTMASSGATEPERKVSPYRPPRLPESPPFVIDPEIERMYEFMRDVSISRLLFNPTGTPAIPVRDGTRPDLPIVASFLLKPMTLDLDSLKLEWIGERAYPFSRVKLREDLTLCRDVETGRKHTFCVNTALMPGFSGGVTANFNAAVTYSMKIDPDANGKPTFVFVEPRVQLSAPIASSPDGQGSRSTLVINAGIMAW